MTSELGAAWPRTVSAVLATVGVVAAVVLAVHLSGSGDSETDSAHDPATGAPPPECPEAPAEGGSAPMDELDPDAPVAVPAGATSVRLCQGVGTDLPDAGALLDHDVSRVVESVNDLGRHAEKPEMCTMDTGPGYRMVFGYTDGSRFTVSGRTYGCRELVVGSAYRIPATEPLKDFRTLAG